MPHKELFNEAVPFVHLSISQILMKHWCARKRTGGRTWSERAWRLPSGTESSTEVLHQCGLPPREHPETAGGLWSWQLGMAGRVLLASSGQRPRWCSTPSKAKDSPAQGPVHSKTSRGSRFLGLEGNRLQWDHHESWLDIYIHTDISALQVLWQQVECTTEDPRHPWGEGGAGRVWGGALRKGQPCRMSTKGWRRWGLGAGESAPDRGSHVQKSLVLGGTVDGSRKRDFEFFFFF